MKNSQLISEMTLEEKASLCSGLGLWHTKSIKRLGIGSIMMTDGPHGLRKQTGDMVNLIHSSVPSTCYPTASCVASSWDTDLINKMGTAIADEALAEKVSIVLGPGTNIKRNPLCGRNFEYFSEDPLLSGKMAASFIKGVEDKKIGVSLKHFCANNQETARLTVSSDIDERTLREIYLKPFEIAVKEGHPSTLMCSYNKINGVFGSENEFTLRQVLRKEWGFKGFVMSDWGASNDRVKGLAAGLELEMPSSGCLNDDNIVAAVKSGALDEAVLDNSVSLLLDFILSAEKVLKKDFTYDIDTHNAISRDIATQSAVLLKNNGILPLDKNEKILVVGAMAQTPRFQGAGSSHITPTKLTSAIDEMRTQGINFDFLAGYDDKKPSNKSLLKKVVSVAASYKKIVIFAGLSDSYEAEGFDRTTLEMPHYHNTLISQVAKLNKNTAVVLSLGAPVTMPWIDDVSAVLLMYLAGQACGGASVDLLFGKANPCGKLAETFPISLAQVPSSKYFTSNPWHSFYKEGAFVGYRYFSTAKVQPLFAFGFGLSYTQYKYSNFAITQDQDIISASFDIENIGNLDGKEISQLYISKPTSGVVRPAQELKGFVKTHLKAGEKKTATIKINCQDLSIFIDGSWRIENGEYEILIGAASDNILHKGIISIKGETLDDGISRNSWYYAPNAAETISDEDFFALYGKAFDYAYRPKTRGDFDINSTFNDMCLSSAKARFIFRIIGFVLRRILHAKKDDSGYLMMRETMRYTPLRNMVYTSQGAFSHTMAEGVTLIMNGKNFKGLRKILSKNKGVFKQG